MHKASIKTPKKSSRKAPSRVSGGGVRTQNTKKLKIAIFALLGLVFLSGSSAYIGMSDFGEINVAEVINRKTNERDAKANAEGGVDTVYTPPIPRADPKNPNGGLRPAKIQPTKMLPEITPVASTTPDLDIDTSSSTKVDTEGNSDTSGDLEINDEEIDVDNSSNKIVPITE